MYDEGLRSYQAIAFISRLTNKQLVVTLKKILKKQKINSVFSKLGEIYG
jgi:hypothetical protein